MDMLWEKFHWILSLYMKPINFQSKASVVFSVTTALFIDFCLKKLNVFPNILVQKNEYLNSTEKITRNWNLNLVSALITSWDITQWCRINLLRKELVDRMSEHTGLISSCQLLITAACTNTGGKMKGCRVRAADRCPFVHRHSKTQVTSFIGFPVVWGIIQSTSTQCLMDDTEQQIQSKINGWCRREEDLRCGFIICFAMRSCLAPCKITPLSYTTYSRIGMYIDHHPCKYCVPPFPINADLTLSNQPFDYYIYFILMLIAFW